MTTPASSPSLDDHILELQRDIQDGTDSVDLEKTNGVKSAKRTLNSDDPAVEPSLIFQDATDSGDLRNTNGVNSANWPVAKNDEVMSESESDDGEGDSRKPRKISERKAMQYAVFNNW